MTKVVRVATWTAEEGVRIAEVPPPHPAQGESVLRVEAAWAGESWRDACPSEEGACRLGRRAVGWLPSDDGERRVLAIERTPCGACPSCQDGHEAQCPVTTSLTGCLADQILLPEAVVAAGVHELPEALPAEAALLAEDLALVLKARDRLAIRPQERAMVFGVGLLGLLFTRVLALTAVEVTYVEMGGLRFDLARSLGAHRTATLADLDPRTERERTDLVIQTSALAHDEALACVPTGGRIAFAGEGAGRTEVGFDVGRLRGEELSVLGCSHGTAYHRTEAIRALAGGLLDAAAIVETIPLEELPIRLDAPAAAVALGPRPVVVRP